MPSERKEKAFFANYVVFFFAMPTLHSGIVVVAAVGRSFQK